MLRQAVWSLLVVVLCVRGAVAQTVWPGEDWEAAAPASQGMDAGGLDKAKAWLESHNSKSGVVIRHGRIVAEWYFGDADRQSKFAAYSTSKSLSSMAGTSWCFSGAQPGFPRARFFFPVPAPSVFSSLAPVSARLPADATVSGCRPGTPASIPATLSPARAAQTAGTPART